MVKESGAYMEEVGHPGSALGPPPHLAPPCALPFVCWQSAMEKFLYHMPLLP